MSKVEELLKQKKELIGFDYTNEKECLKVVQQYGYALKYVKEQTPEICLAAVKQNGLVLQYVENRAPEICIAAVKENRFALQFVQDNMIPEVAKLLEQEK